MKTAFLLLVLLAHSAHAGLQSYRELIAADTHPARGGIRITYLGVNGYQFEADGHVLLVDPYFSRVSFWSVAFGQPIAPDPARIAAGLSHVRPRVDAVLVTHAHFDHLLDVPEVMRRTGAQLMAGPTAVRLVESLGISPRRCSVVGAGERRKFGPWTIRVLAAQHDRLLGRTPFPGRLANTAPLPRKASDWKLGEPLAFVIEAKGQRIYLDSGGLPGAPLPRLGKIDLAILGVALPDSRRRFAEAVIALHPRYILPSHQDDFFVPFERGFQFGKMTSFPTLLRVQREARLPGRIILLDYFQPWTLR